MKSIKTILMIASGVALGLVIMFIVQNPRGILSGNLGGGEGQPELYNKVTTTNYTYADISSKSTSIISANPIRNYLKCVNNGPKTVFISLASASSAGRTPFPVLTSASFELTFNSNPYVGAIYMGTANDVGSTSLKFSCIEGNEVLTAN